MSELPDLDRPTAPLVERLASVTNGPAVTLPLAALVLGFWPLVALAGIAVPGGWFVMGGMIIGSVIAAIALGLVYQRLTVDDENVTVSWLGRRSSVALRDVAGVAILPRAFLTPARVRLVLRSGVVFDIVVGAHGRNPFEPFVVAEVCERIATRIHHATRAPVRARVEVNPTTEAGETAEPDFERERRVARNRA